MSHCFVDSTINNVTDSFVDALKSNVSNIAQPPTFKLKFLSIETRPKPIEATARDFKAEVFNVSPSPFALTKG